MAYLNDEYTLDINTLGYKSQADVIRDVILNAQTPFTVGISGRWGSGKTSMMKYLMASLGGVPLQSDLDFHTETKADKARYEKIFKLFETTKPKREKTQSIVQTLWFNPWENEKHDEPLAVLLQIMYSHFSTQLSLLDKSKKLAIVSIEAGLATLTELLSLTKSASIRKIGETYENEQFQKSARSQKFKLLFEEAIAKLIPHNLDVEARLVIFVDDLDRCEEQTIAKLLKEIKQYLSTKRCVFVFGYDRHHIEKSLAKVETKTSKETRAYLEKLFQTTFYIKQPNAESLREFIRQTLDSYKINDAIDLKNMSDYISKIVDPNPRRLKAFIASYYFHIRDSSFAYSADIISDDLEKLALIAYLKIFYESVYTAIEHDNDLMQTLTSFLNGKRDPVDVTNAKEYYFMLEFKNHLKKGETDSFNDGIENTKDFEEKFLSEVYEMQGRHKHFETFTTELSEKFFGMNNDELKTYL